MNNFYDDDQTQQLLGIALPEQQFQNAPQFTQGLLNPTDDQSQNLQEVIAKGLQAAGQIGQTAQPMLPLGGNRIAQRMAATQNQARQALDRQQQQQSRQRVAKYDARGYLKSLETLPTDERDAALKNRYGDNPDMLTYLKRQTTTPESQVNTEILRQYLPNGDWQGATADAQRLQASKLAEAIRAQAKAGGVDLAGYSPRQAKNFAGYNARDYQANRVAYLDNLYNSYGRDGLVTTPLGNQIIGQLATENPMLANFYANAYPGAKDTLLVKIMRKCGSCRNLPTNSNDS